MVAAGCGGGQGKAPASTTRPTGTSVRTAASYDWSRAAVPDLGGGASATLSAVMPPAAAGGDWTIAGTVESAGGATAATVWRSPDALTWSRTALPGPDGRALAATRSGERTVVVGSVGQGSSERAAVWVSAAPGAPFSAVAANPAFEAPGATIPAAGGTTPTTGTSPTSGVSPGTGGASMDAVSAGTLGVFAAGSVSGSPAVWYSSDGATWSQVASAEKLIDGATGARVNALLVDANGVYAAGTVRDGTDTDGALWTSVDGIRWQRYKATADPFVGGGDHTIDGLAWTGTALVAVGGARTGSSWQPASWLSPNQTTTWGAADTAFPEAARPQPTSGGSVVRAVAVDPGPVAAGAGGRLAAVGGSGTVQRLWISTNGRQWTETPLPDPAAGSAGWSAGLVATRGSTTVVADSEIGQPYLLVVTAGGWHQIDSPVFGTPRPTAEPAAVVSTSGRTLLAVDVDRPGTTVGSGAESAAVLASTGGSSWSTIASGGVFAGDRITGLTAVDGGLVAVGANAAGTRALVWTSTTGATWKPAFTGTAAAPEEAASVGSLGSLVAAVGTQVAAPGRSGGDSSSAPTPETAATAWLRTPTGWAAGGPLDAKPLAATEQPAGTCSDAHVLVVVGSASPVTADTAPATGGGATTTTTTTTPAAGPTASTASSAVTWATTDGLSWTAGTVRPVPPVGGDETMTGCVAVGRGFVAYGRSVAGDGTPVEALWSSPDGIHWDSLDVPTLAGALPAPVSGLAASGAAWLAVGGGVTAAQVTPGDPVVATSDPLSRGDAPDLSTAPGGEAGVWVSQDSGAQWSAVDTGAAPWTGGEQVTTDLAAWAGATPVVAGTVDGRLTVWDGAGA